MKKRRFTLFNYLTTFLHGNNERTIFVKGSLSKAHGIIFYEPGKCNLTHSLVNLLSRCADLIVDVFAVRWQLLPTRGILFISTDKYHLI